MSSVIELHCRLSSLFRWTSDEEVHGMPEHWTSHLDTFRKGEYIYDDCDGRACTMAELLVEEGVNPEDIYLSICLTDLSSSNPYDHAVCLVRIDGELYLSDNRYPDVLPKAMDPGYRYYSYMCMNNQGEWFSGLPSL